MYAKARVLFSGKVQGVYFRAFTREAAGSHSLTGWVRNLPDGRVEAVFEGAREAIETVIDKCKGGPPGARVEDVEVRWEDYTGHFPSFTIKT